jgi:hypothetical protein
MKKTIQPKPNSIITIMLTLLICSNLFAQNKKPNIVVIWGDDIGYWNVGAYTHGMMGKTPNIDGLARDGMLFYRSLWTTKLYSWPCSISNGPKSHSYRYR